MSARDVARLARDTIAIARERQTRGDALLVFVEGTRSRTASMQRTLPAVVRYFDAPGTLLVPVGITGSESLVPVGDEHLHAAPVAVRLGRPASAADLVARAEGNRRLVMDAVGVAIAQLLPARYRGEYGDDGPHGVHAEARALSDSVFGTVTPV